ncbi:Crp/Fnr family transcriptional regulator [Nonlabens xiamenensis]|uniref:Crp/Fnr family transcriptional regulator n=1 Tax=Nonlabens xiamenensis TaxID=2341043 RepID=UPI000F61179D|nr:Crp/Fnr family transcriptional regulator [Nonlabens xiamenensis]
MLLALTEKLQLPFEPELLEEIQRLGTYRKAQAGEVLIKPGQVITSTPLLLKGSLKIMRPDDQGDGLLLYHLEPGSTCAMSLNCCTGKSTSEIVAVAETDVELIMLPVQQLEYWNGRFKSWRNFVFNSYQQRMTELLESIDSIAFQNMDQRLSSYLTNKAAKTENSRLEITHQEIANDLHTSRVVVSRLLKKMESNQLIKMHRNCIEML